MNRSRRVRGDDGLSMMELLVSMLIIGIVSAFILSLFINSTKAIARSSALSQNTQAAANIENEVTRVIRSATPNPVTGGTVNPAVVAGSNESLTVLSLVDSGLVTSSPIQVVFSLSGRQVVEKRYTPKTDVNGLYVFTSPTLTLTRTLPGPLTVPTGTSPTYLFTYYDASGNPLVVSTALTPTQCALVDAIKVTVVTNATGDPNQAPVTIANTVALPNAN